MRPRGRRRSERLPASLSRAYPRHPRGRRRQQQARPGAGRVAARPAPQGGRRLAPRAQRGRMGGGRAAGGGENAGRMTGRSIRARPHVRAPLRDAHAQAGRARERSPGASASACGAGSQSQSPLAEARALLPRQESDAGQVSRLWIAHTSARTQGQRPRAWWSQEARAAARPRRGARRGTAQETNVTAAGQGRKHSKSR